MPVTPARGRQLSLVGVEARPPAPIDLEGLLAGAGQVGRMGGTGRVSIVVDDAWRCAVLRAELERRGLVVTCEAAEDERWALRTAYSSALAPLAARWLDDEGVKVSPPGLVLDGWRLRLWVEAAGAYDGQRSYLLRLAPCPRPAPDEPDESGPSASDPAAGGSSATLSDEWARAEREAHAGATRPGGSSATLSEEWARAEREAHAGREGSDGSPATLSEEWARAEREAHAGREGSDGGAGSRPAARPSRDDRPNVRKRKSESKITAFDPGPDEFADAEDFFADAAADEWPDSGVGDLPTVVLDPVSAPVGDDSANEPGIASTPGKEESIDRRMADNWIAVGDALAAVGLPAVLVGAETGGPAYRIVGPRRITRLAELIGDPPAGVPAGVWPG